MAKRPKLKAIRAGLGLTQEQMAKRVGCSASWLSRVEAGHYTHLRLEDALRIAKAYGVEVSTLARKSA